MTAERAQESPTRTTAATSDGEPRTTPVPLARLGNPSDICEAEVIEDFSIKAIIKPKYASDWTEHAIDSNYTPSEAGEALPDGTVVIGREHNGTSRAYPLPVLWHHEIVNANVGIPLIVTYCSICRSGLVADRRIQGEVTQFGVSGQLWLPPDRYISASVKAGRSFGAGRWNATDTRVREGPNLVMYDYATRSFWSQAIGQAICGPLTGTRLEIVPSTLATWGDWRSEHPDTGVLLPPPHSQVQG